MVCTSGLGYDYRNVWIEFSVKDEGKMWFHYVQQSRDDALIGDVVSPSIFREVYLSCWWRAWSLSVRLQRRYSGAYILG